MPEPHRHQPNRQQPPRLDHIENWVFDLDNTLYAAECQLFAQIDARMTDFIRTNLRLDHAPARALQKQYYVDFGTTMSGLMHEHDISPDAFMDYVHDIDLAPITQNPQLNIALGNLPGRKFIYTNGSVKHAENVAGAIGVLHHFDAIFDIKAAGYTPKPNRAPYEQFLKRHAVAPSRAAMFEDLMHNLEAPHALGMTTVLVQSEAPWLNDEPADKRPAQPGDTAPHIHYITDDLAGFLNATQSVTINASSTAPA